MKDVHIYFVYERFTETKDFFLFAYSCTKQSALLFVRHVFFLPVDKDIVKWQSQTSFYVNLFEFCLRYK